MNAATQELVPVVEKPQRQLLMVTDPVPMLDTARFEHMQRVATVMADCSLIPVTLQGNDFRQTMANCFMVVNFAVQAKMDPFAVAQCASVIHGKLCFEGKLIAAMIAAKLGTDLEYEWNTAQGDAFGIKVFMDVNGKRKDISGTVGDWKTKDKQGNINGQWVGNKAKMQLAYRGAREWCRLHKPGIILGVYSDDEMMAASDMRDVTPLTPPRPSSAPPRPSPNGAQPEPAQSQPAEDELAGKVVEDAQIDDEIPSFDQGTGEAEGGEDWTSSSEPEAPSDMLTAADDEMAVAKDEATVLEIWESHDLLARLTNAPNGEEFIAIAKRIRDNHLKRVGKK